MPTETHNSVTASNGLHGATTGENAASTSSRNRPLNPALRPQRLFHKVQIAMKAVDKKIFDPNVTGISNWLNEDEMNAFRRAIRQIIRVEYNATFDNWPKRTLHDYVPDARKAILQAINENLELFSSSNITGDDHYDDFVPGELLFPRIYTE